MYLSYHPPALSLFQKLDYYTENSMQYMRTKTKNGQASWRRTFLIVAGIAEALVLVPGAVLSAVIAVSGFAAGETGAMVGILSSAVLIFLLPLSAGRVTAVYGLFKRKPWAAILTIIIYGLCLPGAFSIAGVSPVLVTLYILYNGFGIWSAVICRRGWVQNPRFSPDEVTPLRPRSRR